MSTTASTTPKRPLPHLDPEIGLICIAADSLIPLFKKGTIDSLLARQMAMSSIEAYCPESRADAVNIARTIAFSMAAIALLGQASADDLTMAMKLRAFGSANTLNRSADQSERTMMQRRRYQRTHQPEYRDAQPAHPPIQPAAPDMQAVEAEIRAVVAEAMKYAAPQTEAKTAKPEPQPPAPTSAIHHSVPKANPGHPQAAPFKSSLLCETALQRVINEDAGLLAAAKAAHPQSATQPLPARPNPAAPSPRPPA